MQYWDTSALLKLYVPEADSLLFSGHLTVLPLAISQIGRAEILRAIVRKEADGAIPASSAEATFGKFLADISSGRVVVTPFDSAVESRFRTITVQVHRRNPPIVLRTLDAIHLATAQFLNVDEIVTTDSHMRAGAAAIGMRLFP